MDKATGREAQRVIANTNIATTVVGTLKGYDQLLNLVLDDVDETLRGMSFSFSFPLLFSSILPPPFLSLPFPFPLSHPHTRKTKPPKKQTTKAQRQPAP